MYDTIIWQSYPSPVRWNLSSTRQISTPRSFPTSVSHPLSDFHPWWHRFGFHSLKTKPENREGDDEGARERDSAAREAHKQTDNWVWGCHSRLLAHTLSFFFFPPVLLLLCTSSLERKAEHPSAQWYVGVKSSTVCKPQSWLKTVKSHYPL